MTQDSDVTKNLLEIFSLVLKQDYSRRTDIVRSEEGSWDSLKHLEIIFAIEDMFALHFEESEIPELKSLHDIYIAIQRKRNAA